MPVATLQTAQRLNLWLATPAGFEPATTRLEGECSIQLSYGVGGLRRRLIAFRAADGNPCSRSVTDPVVTKVVGIALRLFGGVLGGDDGVVEAKPVGKGDRFIACVEA